LYQALLGDPRSGGDSEHLSEIDDYRLVTLSTHTVEDVSDLCSDLALK
jgi:hypothetical protein